jgi:septal ring factor EnvC (AmiA/AmiB activator)
LVSTLKKEVKHLEAAAAKAEEEKKAIESKKKKIGGKKKQKKEIEKAYEFAMGEQKKVAEAREQLDAARRQSDVAKAEADKLRQQYEEAEVEAATAASYMSVNASNSVAPSVGGGSVVAQQHYQQQYQQPAPTNDAYADPFGMGASMGQPAAVTASDPYGMGLMGGSANGDYANPFAM